MSDNVTDITVHILHDIRDEMRSMREGVSSMRAGQDELRREMRTEFTAVRDEMRGMRVDLCERIDQTNARIDNLITVSGGGQRDHEARIVRLEGRVDRLDRPRRPRR